MNQHTNAAVAAIAYALEADQGMEFLSYWNEGEFDKCRRHWPDAPEAAYIGADPLLAASTDRDDGYDITVDFRDLHDFARAAILDALTTDDAPGGLEEANTRAVKMVVLMNGSCQFGDDRSLPPLPYPALPVGAHDYFSASQMRQYARLAIKTPEAQ